MKDTTQNIHWEKVKTGDVVIDCGLSFVVIRDGKRFLVNWSSYDSNQAIRFLWGMVAK